MRNYYKEIDEALLRYETFMPYKTRNIGWLTSRIDWCYKFKHITESQKDELCDRVSNVISLERCY